MIAAVLAFLQRVPPRLYLIALIVAALAVGGYAMYRKGEHAGEKRVHQVALADSVHTAEARRDTAVAHSDTAVHVAKKARATSDSTRAQRAAARTAALAELLDDGLPKIHALVALDDSLSARDSITIAVQAGAIDTLLAERAARAQLDSLRVNQSVIGAPAPETHHLRDAATGAAVVAIVYAVVRRLF